MEAISLPPDEAIDHGEVFTRRWVVELVLDLCGYTTDRDLAALQAIEPACGMGAFLTVMSERLVRSARAHGRDMRTCGAALTAFDLLPANVEASRAAVDRTLRGLGVEPATSLLLTQSWIEQRDFLLDPLDETSVDLVVGNPPYIRLEAVPPARSAAYRRVCETMGGRADVYVGFYELGLRALRPSGMLGFICADRWMRNAYGARLRKLVSTEWSPEAIVSMTGVDAFEEPVDAYPAITVFQRSRRLARPLIVDTEPSFGEREAKAVASIARDPDQKQVATPAFRAARLRSWFSGRGGWPNGSPARLAAIADLERRLPALEDASTGTRVGIGVATGADSVFIADRTLNVEEERLLPLAMPRDIATGKLLWSGRQLVNPWDASGLVALDAWPRMAAYLGSHQARLAARHTARRGQWHKTIDRVIEGLVERPKLYVPDFKDRVFPVLDRGTTYPHHNLYWITSEAWDLQVLGGLLLSDVANLFTDAYSVRMRGGYLRFQAQYLRRVRVPRPEVIDGSAARALAAAFEARDRFAATRAALPLYELSEVPN